MSFFRNKPLQILYWTYNMYFSKQRVWIQKSSSFYLASVKSTTVDKTYFLHSLSQIAGAYYVSTFNNADSREILLNWCIGKTVRLALALLDCTPYGWKFSTGRWLLLECQHLYRYNVSNKRRKPMYTFYEKFTVFH